MTNCPVSGLPVTEKEHWSFKHRQGNYIRKYSLIGTDILHVQEIATHLIVPDRLYPEDFQSLITEQNLAGTPLSLLMDCAPVSDLSRSCKKEFTSLLLAQDSPITLIVLYNVSPAVRLQFEMLQSLENTQRPLILAATYEEAVRSILDSKSGAASSSSEPGPQGFEKEFLAEMAAMLLQKRFNRQLSFPPEESSASPYFKMLELMRRELKAIEKEHQHELERIEQKFRTLLASKNSLLDAQVEQSRQIEKQHKEREAALLSQIDAQKLENSRISTVIAEKNVSLRSICGLLQNLDLDPAVKEQLSSRCSALFETASTASLVNTELTETDSAFLSKLQKRHPDLNQRELRIGLLIKLDYHSRDIAKTLGLSTRGIESIRYRLHKKVGLDKHLSLKTYLTDLATEQA